MKIVIINGSPRTDGLTATVLLGISNALIEHNIDISYYDLGRLTMAQCLGCCSCYKTGHCVIDDDVERISNAIADADGLVLGTPTYASNVSGLMKVLIDRGHFVIEQLLNDKYCVTVATGENYGSRDAGKVLDRLVLYSGGHLTKSIVINAPFNSLRSWSSKDTDIHCLANKTGQKLYDAIRTHKRYTLQAAYHNMVFGFGIRPFVLRKGEKYTGVITKWKGMKI